jgi:hypothetical protein
MLNRARRDISRRIMAAKVEGRVPSAFRRPYSGTRSRRFMRTVFRTPNATRRRKIR